MQKPHAAASHRGLHRVLALASGLLLYALMLIPQTASALPIFARQTGQNCVACHAGGQFPELTPYGRMFKLTGYTIGKRTTLPFAVMAVAGAGSVSSTTDAANGTPDVTYGKNGTLVLGTESVFVGGKITDTTGAFVQFTHDNWDGTNKSIKQNGSWGADNMDFRYADHWIDGKQDLIFGVSVNNNPSVSDPWNSAPAWMGYVPAPPVGAAQFADGAYPGTAFPDIVAGATAYMLWNKSIYGEVGLYRTADKAFSFMSAGQGDVNSASPRAVLRGTNPYYRLAYTHEWGPHNIMVGTSGSVAHVYDATGDTSDSGAYQRFKNIGVDAQYQYLLDPHTVTAQLAYSKQTVDDSVNGGGGNGIDKPNVLRGKLSYVYQAKYGGSVSYFNQTDAMNPTVPTRGFVYEAFWTPVQYVRVGAQYTAYSKYAGATDNYDGFGRNAKDNNTLLFYVWGAY